MVVAQAGYLIPAPLLELLARRELEAGSCSDLAERLGVDEARIRKIGRALTRRDGRPLQTGLVTVKAADEWATRLGARLGDLYGPLYGLAIPESDACGDACLMCGELLRTPALICGFCMEEGRQS